MKICIVCRETNVAEIMGTVCIDHYRSLHVPFSFLRTCQGVTEQTPMSVPRSTTTAVDCARFVIPLHYRNPGEKHSALGDLTGNMSQ
jgi:hypothetical protein